MPLSKLSVAFNMTNCDDPIEQNELGYNQTLSKKQIVNEH